MTVIQSNSYNNSKILQSHSLSFYSKYESPSFQVDTHSLTTIRRLGQHRADGATARPPWLHETNKPRALRDAELATPPVLLGAPVLLASTLPCACSDSTSRRRRSPARASRVEEPPPLLPNCCRQHLQ